MNEDGAGYSGAIQDLAINGAAHLDPADPCECRHCHRRFTSARGMKVHVSRMHRNAYHEEELAKFEDRIPVKRRWTEAEVSEMAYQEAILLANDVLANINQELQKMLQGRTLESIKGKRRGKEYKEMVSRMLETIRFE